MPAAPRFTLLSAAILLSACSEAGWSAPLENAGRRPQLLTFGLHVTPDPAHNPIDPPERFTGYHTALDYEILPGEENTEVPVYAACDGEVVAGETAEGYGGVIVQRCVLEGLDVTVLYGHLDPASFAVKAGDTAEAGRRIAVLAAHKTPASGGTRKHLHLGIHRGREIDMRGYVQTRDELRDFVDPQTVLRP